MNSTDRGVLPPYGPTRGMIQGLLLLQKGSVSRIDEALLRTSGIAPGNEYKVVGALRYLGLVDELGRPTEASRGFKTRGPAYTLALQESIRKAYSAIFSGLDLRQAAKEDVYNYFVMEMNMGPEMAAKAARFFVELCRVAELELSPALQTSGRRGRPTSALRKRRSNKEKTAPLMVATLSPTSSTATSAPSYLPIVLTVTPETVSMGEDELALQYKKMLTAFQRAQASL
ncbi:MAG: hypothetical protein HW403_315 [Dehalococcoidia bacterium]|nr:hypothetical protein [Dehalococcoidia bacterium]